jgi:hypothetical protein
MVVIIVLTAQTAPTYAVEILILIYIIVGGAYAMIFAGLRTRTWRQTGLRNVLMVLILGTCGLYCSWFWVRGIHNPNNMLDTPCGTYIFLFAKVSFYNRHLTTFFTVMSIYATVLWLGAPILGGILAAASSLGINTAKIPAFLVEIGEV